MKLTAMESKMRAALRVARMVEVPERLVDHADLEAYSNCREQGLLLRIWRPGKPDACLAWSEDRRSDDIVLYVGEDFPRGMITEEAYEARMFHTSAVDCAEEINRALARIKK